MFPITFLSILNPKVVVVGCCGGHWGDSHFNEREFHNGLVMPVVLFCSLISELFMLTLADVSFSW